MTPDYLDTLFPAPRTNAALSSATLIAHMITIERAYFAIQGGAPSAYDRFQPDFAALREAMARDGIVVAELVRQMRGFHDDARLHKGMTSQDVMDTAYTMSFASLNADFGAMIKQIEERLDDLNARFGDAPLMARTRMQAALEVTAAHRLSNWQNGFTQCAQDLTSLRPALERLTLGGAVGDGRDWADPKSTADALAESLNLSPQNYVTHSLRAHIQDYGNWLTKLTGHIGKIGQDIALMAQQGIDEVTLSSAGGSSAMAHKSNPVQAEVLVSLARYNAGLLGTLAQSLIHEQERSGAAWSLEWLVLPQMLTTTEASLEGATHLLGNIERLGRH